jgi:hypothetical protein
MSTVNVKTEFKYERGIQPAPKLGEWVAILTELLEKEAKPAQAGAPLGPAPVRGTTRPRLRWRP